MRVKTKSLQKSTENQQLNRSNPRKSHGFYKHSFSHITSSVQAFIFPTRPLVLFSNLIKLKNNALTLFWMIGPRVLFSKVHETVFLCSKYKLARLSFFFFFFPNRPSQQYRHTDAMAESKPLITG